jgi:hypothetical protein
MSHNDTSFVFTINIQRRVSIVNTWRFDDSQDVKNDTKLLQFGRLGIWKIPFFFKPKKRTCQMDRQLTADPELFFSLFQEVEGFYVCTCKKQFPHADPHNGG